MKKDVELWIGVLAMLLIAQVLLGHTTVYVEPLRIQGKVGDNIQVQLRIKDGRNVFAWAIDQLDFNPDILQGVSVSQGTYLSSRGGTLWGAGVFDNVNGTLHDVYCTLMGSVPSAWGDGVLATITFHVIGSGDFLLDIAQFELVRKGGTEGMPYIVIDGWYGTQSGFGGVGISTATNHQEAADIAWDLKLGDRYVAVWEDKRDGSQWDIYGQRVFQNGTLDGTNYLTSLTSGGSSSRDQRSPALAYNPRSQLFQMGLVVFEDTRNTSWVNDSTQIFGHLIYNGAPSSSDDIQISSIKPSKSPRIAAKDDTFFVVFEHRKCYFGATAQDTEKIIGQFVGSLGMLIGDTCQINLLSGNSGISAPNSYPDVAYGGGKFLCVWTGKIDMMSPYNSIRGRLITSQGMSGTFDITPSGISDPKNCFFPCLAFDGTNFLVIWSEGLFQGANENTRIRGRFVSPSGTMAAIFTIANGAPMQNAAIAFDATNGYYVMTWADQRDGYYNVYAQRISTEGALLGNLVLVSGAQYSQLFPAVAYGNSILTVWQDARNAADYDVYGDSIAPLGIGLTAFTATSFHDAILLRWRVDEENTVAWRVYRSPESSTGYQCIGSVSANGNSPGPMEYEYVDKSVVSGTVYYYCIESIDPYGHETLYGPVSASIALPPEYVSIMVQPDPFRERVTISLVGEPEHRGIGESEIKIYDVSGRLVRKISLLPFDFSLGAKTAWDGRNDSGEEVSPGVYFIRYARPGTHLQAKRVTLMR
jgi:hypothetical protein